MKRQMMTTVTLQLLVELDIDLDAQQTRVGVLDANYSVLGKILKDDTGVGLSKEHANAVGLESTKLGAQWLIDKLSGKLEEPVPVVNQVPGGASA